MGCSSSACLLTASASLGCSHKEGLHRQMLLLWVSSLPTLKTGGRSSSPASTRETLSSRSCCFWGALFPWPPVTRRCFPKLFSRDVAAGCQRKPIPLRQIVISPETDVGWGRKRRKLPQSISVPLLQGEYRPAEFPKRAAWASRFRIPSLPRKAKRELELEANNLLGGELSVQPGSFHAVSLKNHKVIYMLYLTVLGLTAPCRWAAPLSRGTAKSEFHAGVPSCWMHGGFLTRAGVGMCISRPPWKLFCLFFQCWALSCELVLRENCRKIYSSSWSVLPLKHWYNSHWN